MHSLGNLIRHEFRRRVGRDWYKDILIRFSSSSASASMKAMCAVGVALFLIASAIILSLIPVYLPQHSSVFYLGDRQSLHTFQLDRFKLFLFSIRNSIILYWIFHNAWQWQYRLLGLYHRSSKCQTTSMRMIVFSRSVVMNANLF